MDRNSGLYGLGAIGLGLLGLVVGDFALQWQPVPEGVPFHQPLAWLSGLLLIAGGAAAVWARTAPRGGLALAAIFTFWVFALHLPKVAAKPGDLSIWLGVAEIGALAIGGALRCVGDGPPSRWLRAGFGVCCLVFGASHFVYAKFTATMIPAWLPAPLVWAYATGVFHAAAGLAFLANIRARLAATMLSAMFAGFVVLLHIPRVLADPTNRMEWTMLLIAVSLTGAAWLVRASTAPYSEAVTDLR